MMMIKRKAILLTLALMAFLCLGIPVVSAADAQPSFTLSVTGKGTNIQVEVKGHQLKDVYAYQFNLEYDPSQVRFKGAASSISGFSVEPIVKRDHILFAHTKIGSAAGTNGNATLATVTFERIANGNASFKLYDVQLVNSSLDMSGYEGDVRSVMAPIRTQFKDIGGYWAELSIVSAVELGWVTGYDDDTFRPQRQVTRAEFAVMLVRALDLPLPDSDPDFADLQKIPNWARPYVAAAADANLIQGYDDGSFRSDKLITRAEMATIVVRAQRIEPQTAMKPSFSDTDSIPLWAQPYVAVAAEHGWIKGRGNNTFAPLQHATRGEAITLIMVLLSE